MHTHTHTYRQAHTYTHMQRVRLGQKIQLYLASARKLCSANSWHFNYIRMDIYKYPSKYINVCVCVCVCVRTCGPALCFEIEKLKNQIQGKPLEPQQLQLQLPSSSLAAAAAAAKAATAAAPVARSAQRRLFGASGGRH